MKIKQFLLLSFLMIASASWGANVTVAWAMDAVDYSGPAVVSGDAASFVTSTAYVVGNKLTAPSMITKSGGNTDLGLSSVNYPNPMIGFKPTVKLDNVTAGGCVTFSVTIAEGHTFKPTKLTFDAAKIGSDKGGLTIKQKIGTGAETLIKEQALARNKPTSATDPCYTAADVSINDVIFNGGQTYSIIIYLTGGLATDKQLALGNVKLEGAVDEGVYDLTHYISAFTCKADGAQVDLFSKVKDMKNGDKNVLNKKFVNEPTDFAVTANAGYTASVSYENKMAVLSVKEGAGEVYKVSLGFMTSKYVKPTDAAPLNRGLMAVHLSDGNLVSWRMREADVPGTTSYKLYRNGALLETFTLKTNYKDASGSTTDIYKVEVCNGETVQESQECKVWDNQYLQIALAKAPKDTNGTGATYTPNDATCFDMDGDGEQEIVFRWEPSNVRDGASSGVTGAVWLECVKLDGTQLWRINLGQNIWASQHTVTFLCHDYDGDGFGEMICRTAPGTIDGEGNYVLMGDDNPFESYVASNGRVSSGPEYLTVFDGATGAAISSIDYWPAHQDYKVLGYANLDAAFGSQAQIERYNATVARLNVGGKAMPCAVMNHGYYSQAYYQAAYFDGTELKQLWRHTSKNSGQQAYGQGYHTLQSADVDGDGFDEIMIGSAALDHDGTFLWRTGEGHGDAMHIGDFDWDNPGLEVFTVLEDYDKSSVIHCMVMRDAKTGNLLWGWPKGDRDCGRGIAADFAPEYDGAESMSQRSSNVHTSKGVAIEGTNVVNDGKNFRIYWDGDLYDDNMDGTWISKWNSDTKQFVNIAMLETVAEGSSSVNGTKNVPCLSADFLGDYREEAVFYKTIDAAAGLYALNIIATNYESEYMLPYLRDDALYDNAIAWQNTTYNQPPHVSYSPVKKWEEIKNQATGIVEVKSQAGTSAPATHYNVLGQRVGAFAKGIIIKGNTKELKIEN